MNHMSLVQEFSWEGMWEDPKPANCSLAQGLYRSGGWQGPPHGCSAGQLTALCKFFQNTRDGEGERGIVPFKS